jgi:O-antigen/teichoic acid export membrane protein
VDGFEIDAADDPGCFERQSGALVSPGLAVLDAMMTESACSVPANSPVDVATGGRIDALEGLSGGESPSGRKRSEFWRIISQKADGTPGKAAISIFDQGVVSGTHFVTTVFIGRLCGQELLGVFYLAWSIVLLARGIQSQVVAAPYMVFCHRRQGDVLASYAGSSLVHQLGLVALGVLAVLIFVVCLLLGWGPVHALPVAAALLGAMPLLMLRDFVRGLSLAHLELTAVVAVDFVVAVVQIGAICLLGWLGYLTVVAVYAVMAVACAIGFCGWLVFSRLRFRLDRDRWLPDWNRNWSFARWALAGHLVGCTSPTLVPWILTLVRGTTATGLFAACMTILGIANVLVGGLSNLAVPRAAEGYAQGGTGQLKRTILVTAAMFAVPCLGFCALVFAAGGPIAVLFYGAEFSGAGPVVVVLACWLLVNSLGIAAGSGLWAMERPAANLLADICVIVVTLLATLSLVGQFGALGAAWGMFLGTSIGMVVRWATVFHFLGKHQDGGPAP